MSKRILVVEVIHVSLALLMTPESLPDSPRAVDSRQISSSANVSGLLISLATRTTPGTRATVSTARRWALKVFAVPASSTTPLLTDCTEILLFFREESAFSAFSVRCLRASSES